VKTEIKKLLLEVTQNRRLITIVGITGVLYSVAYSRLALLLKDLMDLLSQGNVQGIQRAIWIALALSLLSNINKYFHLYLMNYITELVGQNLRNKLQAKFTRLNLSFHHNYSTGPGGLISRTLSDVRTIQDGLRMVADIFLHPLLFVLLLGNLFYLDWKLTLFAFSLLPFILLVIRKIASGIRKYTPMGFQYLEAMASVIKETLDGIRIIQSFNLGPLLEDKFNSIGKKYTDSRRSVHKRSELMGPFSELIATGVLMLVLLYITYQVSRGEATTGSFLAYVTSLLMLNPPLKRAQETYVRIQEVLIASERVYQIIEAPHEVTESESGLPFPEDWRVIRFQNVCLRFGEIEVLKNVSFEVRRGEKIAFVGESGSGKSTILNLLLRFYEPTSGSIQINGVSISDLILRDLRQHIALVSQDVFLFNDTIEKNILAGNLERSSSQRLVDSAKHANAHDFIERSNKGYQTIVGDRGALLSGGEKQRISIARALFKDAPILILDEATSALDSTNELEVQKGIDFLMSGRTSFVVAHRLSTIQNVDRIYVIKSGQISEIGKHEELLKKQGDYYRFYQLQSMGG